MSLFTKSTEAPPARARIFAYGESGAGKTTLGLSWPGAVVLDILEDSSAQYRQDFDFAYLSCRTIDHVNDAISELARGGHPYKTLIIDPISLLFDEINQKWLNHYRKIRKDPNYELKFKDFGSQKKESRAFIRRLQALDMNIICLARSKPKYDMAYNPETRKTELTQVGTTWDGLATLSYEFDIAMKLEKLDAATRWTIEKFRGSRFAKLPSTHEYGFGKFYSEFSRFLGDTSAMEKDVVDSSNLVDLHLPLIETLKGLGLGEHEQAYLHYLGQKYGILGPSELSLAESEEQKKILASLTGNDARIKAFVAKLTGENA